MSRAILAVMAGLLCALAGVRRAASLKAEAEALGRWAETLPALALILCERTLSLPDALIAAADGHTAPDRLLHAIAEHMHHDPLKSPLEAYEALASPGSGHETLRRLFSRLGRGTLEMRRLAAEQAAAEMSLLAQQAAHRAQKDAKLFQTLGFTGGACLTMMLL